MTCIADPIGDLCAARDRIVSAVLYRVFAEQAYAGRETAGESADLDHAHDQEDEAFAAYVTAVRASTPAADVVPAPVIRLSVNPVGWEACPPAGDPVHVRIVCQTPVEALDHYRELYPVARRLREHRLSAPAGPCWPGGCSESGDADWAGQEPDADDFDADDEVPW